MHALTREPPLRVCVGGGGCTVTTAAPPHGRPAGSYSLLPEPWTPTAALPCPSVARRAGHMSHCTQRGRIPTPDVDQSTVARGYLTRGARPRIDTYLVRGLSECHSQYADGYGSSWRRRRRRRYTPRRRIIII